MVIVYGRRGYGFLLFMGGGDTDVYFLYGRRGHECLLLIHPCYS